MLLRRDVSLEELGLAARRAYRRNGVLRFVSDVNDEDLRHVSDAKRRKPSFFVLMGDSYFPVALAKIESRMLQNFIVSSSWRILGQRGRSCFSWVCGGLVNLAGALTSKNCDAASLF